METLSVQIRQKIFEGEGSFRNVEQILKDVGCGRPLVICGGAFKRSGLSDFFIKLGLDYCIYDGFQPNPTYENVIEGLRIFHKNKCDFIISVGGGSAMDTAKCIKAYAGMQEGCEYIAQTITDSKIPHLAMPTTAGTGSESTHFAVIYYKGNKTSVSHDCLLPEYVILEPTLLATLPDYQKKATLMDALCQATESYWSVKANHESRMYAKEAITLILNYGKSYIQENKNLTEVFRGANLAGRAINITTTTLAHAMSYKLTSMYGIAHGHAVGLCMPYVWEYLASHTGRLREGQTKERMEQTLHELNVLYQCSDVKETIAFFRGLLKELSLKPPVFVKEDLDMLAGSVNRDRMGNFPAVIEKEELKTLYGKILTDERSHELENQ